METLNVFWSSLSNLVWSLPATFNYGDVKIPYFSNQPGTLFYLAEPISRATQCLVLVHGRTGQASDFNPLVANLRQLGYVNPILVPQLTNHGSSRIDENTEELTKIVQTYRSNFSPDVEFIFVGLSKGGLIALNYAVKQVHPPKVISISSPLYGTKVVCLTPCEITRDELRYLSPRLLVLEQEVKRRNVMVYNIYSDVDHLVIPADSAYYDFCQRKLEVGKDGNYTYLGHIGALWSRTVAEKIIEWLK